MECEIRMVEDMVFIEHEAGDESGWIIKCEPSLFVVYEIPQYGGEPIFSKSFTYIQNAIKHAETFT